LYFNGVCIDTATTVITTKAKQTINANFLKIGDSTTESGFDHESDSLQTALPGTLVFIGTKTTNGVNHEGVGGYYYYTFSRTFPGTYSTNYPFNNNGVLDFNHYITHNSLANPDIVCFRLGINDCISNAVDQTLPDIQANMEKLVDSLHSQFPNTLIIVSLTSICEGTGGAWLSSYGSWDNPNPASHNTYDNYQKKMRALWKITHDLYQGGRMHENIQISYEGLCIDRINMFKLTDCVHPNDAGYYQYGYILSNSLNYYKK
jgi:lysophospholipase L1-like esterase